MLVLFNKVAIDLLSSLVVTRSFVIGPMVSFAFFLSNIFEDSLGFLFIVLEILFSSSRFRVQVRP